MKNYTANAVGYTFFGGTVCKVSADSKVYNTLVEGPSFEFSCYCLLYTALATTTVARLVSKRTVKCFFDTGKLRSWFSIFFCSRGPLINCTSERPCPLCSA